MSQGGMDEMIQHQPSFKGLSTVAASQGEMEENDSITNVDSKPTEFGRFQAMMPKRTFLEIGVKVKELHFLEIKTSNHFN